MRYKSIQLHTICQNLQVSFDKVRLVDIFNLLTLYQQYNGDVSTVSNPYEFINNEGIPLYKELFILVKEAHGDFKVCYWNSNNSRFLNFTRETIDDRLYDPFIDLNLEDISFVFSDKSLSEK